MLQTKNVSHDFMLMNLKIFGYNIWRLRLYNFQEHDFIGFSSTLYVMLDKYDPSALWVQMELS